MMIVELAVVVFGLLQVTPCIRGAETDRDFILTNLVQVPRVGFGTAGLGDRAEATLRKALDVGFRHIDTAQATEWYDESALGRVLEEVKGEIPREALFITTKIHPRDFGYERTLSAFEDSISKLKTDYIDLLLLHAPWCWEGLCEPDPGRGTYQDAWRALEDLYSKGRVRAIGVSNFPAHLLQELKEASRFGFHSVQNWMDPLHQDREVRQWCAREQVLYTSYSTLGTQWHMAGQGGRNRVLGHPVITSIAEAHGVSPAMVVLSWALEEGAAVIPRSTNPAHIEELARLLGDATGQEQLQTCLTPQDIQRINALDMEEQDAQS